MIGSREILLCGLELAEEMRGGAAFMWREFGVCCAEFFDHPCVEITVDEG